MMATHQNSNTQYGKKRRQQHAKKTTGGVIVIMVTIATHFVIPDWYHSQEGKDVMASVLHRSSGKRKVFGLLERPSFPPQLVPDEFQYKIFVSGKSGVGKTSTVATLTGNSLPTTHSETPGIQMSTVYWPARMVDIDKVVMFQLQFWDAGENALKKFDHILPACKDRTDAALFLFSFVDKASFEDLPQQQSRVLEATDNVCRFVIGTKLDQHCQSEITQRDIVEFEQQWKLPVMTIKNIPGVTNTNGEVDVPQVAPLLNYMCDQLWLRDQILAGRIQPPDYSLEGKISSC